MRKSSEQQNGYPQKIKKPNALISSYTLTGEIARRGPVVISRARNRKGSLFAVKSLPVDSLPLVSVTGEVLSLKQKQEKILELKFEAEIHASLQESLYHPNITRFHELIIFQETPYLIKELALQGSLAEFMKKNRPLTPFEVADFVLQIAKGTQYAHSKGIIHNDLKLANILMNLSPRTDETPNGYGLTVNDFENAISVNARRPLSPRKEIKGSMHYMAPEQWEGKPVEASDQYALAVIMTELLTGTVPFNGGYIDLSNKDSLQKARERLEHAHKNEKPKSFVQMLLNLEYYGLMKPYIRFIEAVEPAALKALSKNVEDRYPTDIAFAEDVVRRLKAEQDEKPLQLIVRNIRQDPDALVKFKRPEFLNEETQVLPKYKRE